MAGEFQSLLPFSFRGLELPVTNITMSLAHDLVEHKYWGVDGGRIEATGLAPLRISATIPISNHIFPGHKETWKAGDLYPTALRRFITQFSKRETGLLQHPEFGTIACKPERMDFTLAGEKQGATEIRASWVETLDDDVALVGADNASPVQVLAGASYSLDADSEDLKSKAPQLPKFKKTLGDLARKIGGIGTSIGTLQSRALGTINQVLSQANAMERALQRAKNPATWPAMQEIQRIKSAANDLRKKLLTPNGVGLYTVPQDSTLAGIMPGLPKGATMADVMKLNTNLMKAPVVPRGSTVRYPIKAA
jgi:prophage DNA circulation protein